MADKPPAYNPNIYPSESPYPPPPPPYQQTTTQTIITGVRGAGQSTTYVTAQGYGQSYGTVGGTPVVVQPVSTTSVIVVGGCPACRVGVLNEDFTLGGLCCAFLFFPIGILCCLAMRERRCTNCGATFSA